MAAERPASDERDALRARIDDLEHRLATLEHERAFLGRLLDAVPAGIAFLDRELVYRYCNTTNAGYLGLPVERIVGQPLERIVPGQPELDAIVRGVVETGEPYPPQPFSIVFAGREADGTRHFLIAFIPSVGAGGELDGIFIAASEITELARTQQRLQFLTDTGARLASSLDVEETLTAISRVAVPDFADVCLLDVNIEGAARSFAWAPGNPERQALLHELRERYPFDWTGQLTSAAWMERMRARQPILGAIAGDAIDRYARDAAHADIIRRIGVTSSIYLPLFARGEIAGTLILAMTDSGRAFGDADVTIASELGRRAEQALENALLVRDLRAAEDRYRGLFEGASDAIVVIVSGQLREVNDAALALTGYTRPELLALAPLALAGPGAAAIQTIEETLARDGIWRGEWELRRADGALVPVESSVLRMELANEPVVLVTIRDISERRRIQHLQRELLAMATHELKGPLTTIRGFAQIIQRQQAYSAGAVETILGQARHLERLVEDMLDASRADSSTLTIRRQEVDLVELTASCAAAAQATTRNHQLRTVLPSEPILAQVDGDRLRQVLANLLSNAVRYAPDGGEVMLTVEADDERIVWRVYDEGIGITPEQLPYIFERFYRAADARRTNAHGLGLGLFITRAIVEAHGGAVHAESTPGAGSTFTVTLPRRQRR